MLEKHTLFVADTFVNDDPSAEQLASIALATEEVRRFGLPPKVAFFRTRTTGHPTAHLHARCARHDLFVAMAPDIECDGEIQGDAALSSDIRATALIGSNLTGEANILICPNLDAANILFNVLKMTGGHAGFHRTHFVGAAGTAHVLTHRPRFAGSST